MKTISFLSLLLFGSCEQKEIVWPLGNTPLDLIVVEAIITNEKIQHTIKLSKPYLEQNGTPEPVTGANVVIATNDSIPEIYLATETPVGSGLYLTDSIRAVSGKIYTLFFNYNSEDYYAFATQPSIEDLDNLSYHPVSDSTFTLDFNESGTSANYIKYMIDWRLTNDCINTNNCQALQIYYDLKNLDVNEIFKPQQEQVNFPSGTIIIRKKYSVSNDYRAYLRGMLSETAWRGGIFDVYQDNLPTNLSDGAIGFFAVSTVLSDTTVIQ